MILLDTSAWIYYFKNGWPKKLLFSDVLTCAPIIQEILQGIKEDAVYEEVYESLVNLPILSNPLWCDISIEAAKIYRSGRKKGYTIRSSVDCLIAAIAIRNTVSVLHNDRDFTLISKYTSLETKELGDFT